MLFFDKIPNDNQKCNKMLFFDKIPNDNQKFIMLSKNENIFIFAILVVTFQMIQMIVKKKSVYYYT
jgi:hypothetical protein